MSRVAHQLAAEGRFDKVAELDRGRTRGFAATARSIRGCWRCNSEQLGANPMRGSAMVSTLQWLGAVRPSAVPHVSATTTVLLVVALRTLIAQRWTYPRLAVAPTSQVRLGVRSSASSLGRTDVTSTQRDPALVTLDERHRRRARTSCRGVTSSMGALALQSAAVGVVSRQLVRSIGLVVLDPPRQEMQAACS